MSTNTTERNRALDGIRGIAILTVVFYHSTMTLGHTFAPIQALLNVTQTGWLGVEIFFALSGFLITGILLKAKADPFPQYIRRFYWRRAMRIFPLYFLVLALLAIIPRFIPLLNTADYARFSSMQLWFWLHSANIAHHYYGMGRSLEFGWFELTHFWTLAVEEHFYLIWPIFIYFLKKWQIVIVALFLIAVSILLRSEILLPSSQLQAALIATPKYVAGLAIGSLGAIYLSESQQAPSDRKSRLVFIVCCAAFAAVCFAYGSDLNKSTSRGLLVPLVAIMTTCVAVQVSVNHGGRMAAALSTPTLVMFGKYSYGIYVYHYIFGPLTRMANLSAWPGGYTVGAFCYVILYLALPLAVAVVSYHYWEKPWLEMKNAFDGPVKPAQARVGSSRAS